MKSDCLVVVATHGNRFQKDWEQVYRKREYPILFVGDEQSDGYDTGKFIWWFQNYHYERYLFLQDSVLPHRDDFVEPFKEHPVAAWAGFPFPMWDDESQRLTAEARYGVVRPARGIFGPVFSATREAMEKITLPLPPDSKLAAQGKEREWSMAFTQAGVPVHFMHDYDIGALSSGACTPFTKVFAGRR
jgi:hypothetical protein